MTKYEYHVHFFDKCVVESKEFQQRLNALGENGWKLKSLQWVDDKLINKDPNCDQENCYELVFIREKSKD
tara:strand:+ start:180 stop:389 length:210 start_codon:yes stop_codon:yes gene_type:complete